MGREIAAAELQHLMLRLQEAGAANINLVSATQFSPAMVEAVAGSRTQGLAIPVVWNSSGYESLPTLELLKDTVDVYLPDCKTLDEELSRQLLGDPDYPSVAQAAVLKMVQDKPLITKPIAEQEKIGQGVIVRHLVLPGLLDQSRDVLRWFAQRLRGRAVLSLMFQYTPVRFAGVKADSQPKRTIRTREYDRVLSWLEELEIDDGYVQDPATGDDWLPDFTRVNPFPMGQAMPIWHYHTGYVRRTGLGSQSGPMTVPSNFSP
jgi:putative pyruvate formate lyase activating enzyme